MKRRAIEAAFLILAVAASAYFALGLLPVARIGRVGIDGMPATPSVERICLSVEGTSRFSISLSALEDRFEELCYVGSCNVDYEFPSTLRVGLELKKDGLVLTDLERCFFCTPDGLWMIGEEDARVLGECFIPLVLDSSSLDYISRYGIENGFGSVVALLLEISSLLMYNQKLVSVAVYQPGDGNGFGTLSLKMADQDCWIDIMENTDAAYLVTLLEKLDGEAVLPFALGTRRYEIKDNVLIRHKVVV